MSATGVRTVLAGCSFAGLELIYRLVRRNGRFAPGEMTVIDPLEAHQYIPLAHEAAGSERGAAKLLFDAPAFCEAVGATVVRGSLERIDEERRVVVLDGGREVEYDRLVIAVGSVPDVPEQFAKATNVIPVKFLDSAQAIRRRLHVLRVGGASVQRVVVVGGGLTGVEWSAELAAARVDGSRVATTLLCANVRILPTFPISIARSAARALRSLGVEILLSSRVAAVNAEHVVLQGGIGIPFDVVVWASGVRPNPVTATLGLPLTEDGHIVVNTHLAVEGRKDIYAVGDCSRIMDARGKAWPTMERAIEAIWEGAYLARHFADGRSGDDGPPLRLRRDFFYGISLGRRRGAVFYRSFIHVSRAALIFRRFLRWAYYARFRLLARKVGV